MVDMNASLLCLHCLYVLYNGSYVYNVIFLYINGKGGGGKTSPAGKGLGQADEGGLLLGRETHTDMREKKE